MATEPICRRCGHERRLHSSKGCTDWNMKTGKECPCKVPYNDVR